MSPPAIRFLAGQKSLLGTLHLTCYVKPGASKIRQGVVSVSDHVIELCVSAQAREGQANKAVVKLLSEVCAPPLAQPLSSLLLFRDTASLVADKCRI